MWRTVEHVQAPNIAHECSFLTVHQTPKPKPPRTAGFTFFEVLAALVLVAIVLPVALRGISTAMSLAGHSRARLEAMRLAEDKMNELLLEGFDQSDELEGDFEARGRPEVAWYAVLDDYEGQTLRELKLWVAYEHGNRERLVAVSTLVYEEQR